MTTKKFISGALTLAVGLTIAGTAAAQNMRGGYRDSARITSCDDARESGTSYRDASARTGNGSGTVVVAKGSDGYRSRFAGAAEETRARQFARVMGLACSN
jgi:hypothetical protein